MSGLLRVNDVFATEPAVVVTATIVVGVVDVVLAIDVVDSIATAVEPGATEVVTAESLLVCVEHPAVTRTIQVKEVIIRRFIKMRIRSFHCNGRVFWLRRSEEWLAVH